MAKERESAFDKAWAVLVVAIIAWYIFKPDVSPSGETGKVYEMQREAVERGFAHWATGSDGEVEFKWEDSTK